MTGEERALIERLCEAIEGLTSVLTNGISFYGDDIGRLGGAIRELSDELYKRRTS